MVRRARTERAASSKAVRELRELLGFSQTELAGVLDVSLGTVARWETSKPPRGEHLLRLKKIADSHAVSLGEEEKWSALADLAAQFAKLYMQEVIESSPEKYMVIRRKGEPTHCLLAMKIEGEEATDAVISLVYLIKASAGKNPSKRAKALQLLASFEDQADEITMPARDYRDRQRIKDMAARYWAGDSRDK
jgi:transcriptional regulator with XRE-family HTH domain